MNQNVEEIRLVELKLCASRTSDENDDVTAVEFADFAGGNFVATFLPGRVSSLKKRLGKGSVFEHTHEAENNICPC